MTLLFVRGFFLIISGVIGYYIGSILDHPQLGVLVGCLCSLILIYIELGMRRVSVRGLSSMVFGLLLGVFMAKLIADILTLLPLKEFVTSSLRVILTLVFSYLGAVMALRGKDEFNIIIPYVRFRRQDTTRESILLDTSAIIDGRIIDIFKVNFVYGRLVIPRFVLDELHKLSDSSDDNKRIRGRRGLDLLHEMQKDPRIEIRISEEEMLSENDVDSRLVKLAKMMDARICTTDYNLGKIATLQGIEVLNINELVDAVKSVVLPGEKIEVRLLKEGKEPHQALAYLDDGTMIVVSDAVEFIGSTKNVVTTSILQTQSGKMIFARLE